MGRSISAGLDSADQPIVVTAQFPIASGDLVKVDVGGWVNKVNEWYPVATQHTAAGVTAVQTAFTPIQIPAGYPGNAYGGAMRFMAALPDGGFAMVHAGTAPSTITTSMSLSIFGPNFTLRSTVVLSAAAGTGPARVVRAGADNVAVVWSESTDLRLAVVNFTTGAIVLASISVGTVTASDMHTWNVTNLANGEVVVAYPSAGSTAFKRYNASGVLQGAEVNVEAAQNPKYFTILPLAASGFILRWAKTSATEGNRMAKFNAAGVIQGAVVAISTGAGSFDGAAGSNGFVGSLEGKLVELSNGNIASTHVATATSQGIKIYDSALTLLTTYNFGTSGANIQDVMQLAAKFGGGFWLLTGSTSGAPLSVSYKLQEYNNAGVLQRQAVGSFSYGIRVYDRPGNGPILVYGSHAPGTPSSNAQAIALKPDLTEEAAMLFIYNNAGAEIGTQWFEPLATGMMVCAWSHYPNSSIQMMGLHLGAASVLGVAQNAAAVGQAVRVATAGKLLMNQNLSSAVFDRRASSPPGTKGTIIGNVALVSGVTG